MVEIVQSVEKVSSEHTELGVIYLAALFDGFHGQIPDKILTAYGAVAKPIQTTLTQPQP